jgi:hypothetical protein
MEAYLGRIVVLLTPVFAGVAGWIATVAAEHLPGAPNLDAGELTAVFVAGAAAVVPIIYKWLEGLQRHESRQL